MNLVETYNYLCDTINKDIFLAYYMIQEPSERTVSIKKIVINTNRPIDETLVNMSKVSSKNNFLFWAVSPEGLKYMKDNEKAISFSMQVSALQLAGYSTEEITRILVDNEKTP